jgi:hypothetical protein
MSSDEIDELSYQEAYRLLGCERIKREFKEVQVAAESLEIGDCVEYDGIRCTVVEIRQIKMPKSAFGCVANNVSIQKPDGKKQAVQANHLKKVHSTQPTTESE